MVSIGGMMDPDAAGFDLEDDSYKAAKVHTKHPTLLENSACISVRGRLKNVIQSIVKIDDWLTTTDQFLLQILVSI